MAEMKNDSNLTYNNFFNMQPIFAKGFSMSPIFKEGDTLYISKKEIKKIITGDIIVFYFGKRFIAHRFFIKKGKKLIVKGDNTSEVEKINLKDYIGVITQIKNKNKIFKTNGFLYRFFSLYFLFVSLLFLLAGKNKYFRKIIRLIFRGRGVIVHVLKQLG